MGSAYDSVLQARDSTTGVKAANAEWLASDVSPNVVTGATKLRVTIAVSVAAAIEVTLDSGTNWVKLNLGSNLVVDSLYTFDVPIRKTDLFNMRTPTVGGTTVTICRVDENGVEG